MPRRRYHCEIHDQDGRLVCSADVTVNRVTEITASVTANNTARIEVEGRLTALAVGYAHPTFSFYLYRWPMNGSRPQVARTGTDASPATLPSPVVSAIPPAFPRWTASSKSA